jgi:exonuclease V gamma subunit
MAAQIADLFDQYQVYRGGWLGGEGPPHSAAARARGRRAPAPRPPGT